MLKHTRVNFELLTDVTWFYSSNIYTWRSESMFQQRRQQVHAIVWSIETINISDVYYDINNLYGWAVSTIPIHRLSLGRWHRQFWRYECRVRFIVTFSRLIWSIRNIFMMCTLIYHFVSREKSLGKRKEKLLAILHDKKRYIIAICSNVLVTVSALQRFIVCNSRNLHDFMNASNSIKILQL